MYVSGLITSDCNIYVYRFLFFETAGSLNASSSQILYVAEASLELPIFLPPFPKCWNYRVSEYLSKMKIVISILCIVLRNQISTIYSALPQTWVSAALAGLELSI